MTKPTILMVENDVPTIDLYRGVLGREYEVLVFSEEINVLEAVTTDDVRAVIIEPAINAGEGWKILTAVIGALHEKKVPVVVCSTLDERKRGLSMGAAAFLVKPVLPSTLLETINQFQQSESAG